MTAGYPVPQSSARKYLSRGNTKVMLTTVPHHPLSSVFGHEKARQRILMWSPILGQRIGDHLYGT